MGDALAVLLAELGDTPAGHLYGRGEVVVDATPYRSARWTGTDGVTEQLRPRFSEAAQEFFRTVVLPEPDPEVTRALAGRKEIERMLEQQAAAVEALAREVGELQATAARVLTHYAEVAAALEAARNGDPPGEPVELTLDGSSLRLPPSASPREAAQELFEEAKRRSVKLAGARAAMAETAARAAMPIPTAPPRERASSRGPSARGKSFWFEKFRWFISSDGAVVIAGRDAASNDLVVKRNLKEGDVYLHADLHGAASVIVKRPAPGAPAFSDATLREAGQWAVAFSKAWRAGLASASAFWVHPDQVSKSPASGEFVPRGAWVIHGTKNFLKDLPVELAVGTIRYDGEERWTAAPESAVRARGTVRALLGPGEDRERASVEVELARELSLSRSVLQSILPAGGLSVRRA